MLYAHLDFQKRFLLSELRKLLGENTCASYAWEGIGAEVHLRMVEWPFEDEVEMSQYAPSESLYYLILNGWLLDPLWVIDENGRYTDDQGSNYQSLPDGVEATYNGVELLASYGHWLLTVQLNNKGSLPPKGQLTNDHGWRLEDIREHETACFVHAYQALFYATKLQAGASLSADDIAKAARVALAMKGAEAKHSKPGGTRSKQEAIRAIWATGKYTSREICAEQEAAGLNMSFATARKALRNTPQPASTGKG